MNDRYPPLPQRFINAHSSIHHIPIHNTNLFRILHQSNLGSSGSLGDTDRRRGTESTEGEKGNQAGKLRKRESRESGAYFDIFVLLLFSPSRLFNLHLGSLLKWVSRMEGRSGRREGGRKGEERNRARVQRYAGLQAVWSRIGFLPSGFSLAGVLLMFLRDRGYFSQCACYEIVYGW